MSIKARTIKNGTIAIVEIRGSFVSDEDAELLRSTILDFIEQGNRALVINLQKVNYINSRGIGAIIAAHASYRKNGGEMKLAGLSGAVQNVLVITRLIGVFDAYDSLAEAIESFSNIHTTS
jgi:anti-sigma B factor antagonist